MRDAGGRDGHEYSPERRPVGRVPHHDQRHTINRFCSSGLQSIASAAHAIIVDGTPCAIGGGLDSISLCMPKMAKGAVVERKLMKSYPALWMPVRRGYELVAARGC